MFLDFYRLREQPFSETPDPRFVYLSATHREALASLFYGIETGRGFLALIAEPGMGKTTLLFHLLEQLRSSSRTAFLFQTQCDSRELLRSLLADLGIDTWEKDLAWMHEQLKRVLIGEASVGRRLVVFIDETQNLTDSALETVRLLSDFETPTSKLMQIVLAGQPQLADKLARPTLAQLRQRVSILCRLNPFTPAETDAYINHRLRVAGYKGGPLFTPDARAMIEAQSKGIPRNINNLCFNALSLGYALGKKGIDSSLVREVANDLEVSPLGSERYGEAFAARPQRGKATVSEAGQQVSNMSTASQPATLTPEPAKPDSVADLQIRSSAPVAGADVLSRDPEASVTDSSPAVTISHAASDARPRQKWVRALSLAGQQLPTMPTASQSATRVPDPVSSNAIVELPKRNLKAFTADLPAEAAPQSTARPMTVAASPVPPALLGSRLRQASRTVMLVGTAVVVLFVVGAAGAFFLHRGTAQHPATTQVNPAPVLRPVSTAMNTVQGVRRSASNRAQLASRPDSHEPPARKPAWAGEIPNGRFFASLGATLHSAATIGRDAPLDLTGGASNAPADALQRIFPPSSNILPAVPLTSEQTAPVVVGGRMKEPRLVSKTLPSYPRAARQTGLEGKVVIDAVLDATGKLTDMKVVSGPALLQRAALDSASKWKYEPSYLDDKPVPVEMFITVQFSLK